MERKIEAGKSYKANYGRGPKPIILAVLEVDENHVRFSHQNPDGYRFGYWKWNLSDFINSTHPTDEEIAKEKQEKDRIQRIEYHAEELYKTALVIWNSSVYDLESGKCSVSAGAWDEFAKVLQKIAEQ